jgi:hypothetical protein
MCDIGASLQELTHARRRSNCPMVSFLAPPCLGFKWRHPHTSVVLELTLFFPLLKCILWEPRHDGTRIHPSLPPSLTIHPRPPEQYIPPIQEPYQYIIFRASEVKDLSVDDPVQAPPRRTHDDPAILAVSLDFFPSNVSRHPTFLDEKIDGCKRVNLVFPRAQKKPMWINRCLPTEPPPPF